MSKILITGGTGKIGTELTKIIENSNIPTRYALRNPDKLKNKKLETVLLDFHNFNYTIMHSKVATNYFYWYLQ